MQVDKNIFEFEWDKGNLDKNTSKHNVANKETEESFLDENKVTFPDALHSSNEERFRIIGKTEKGRLLFIVFTKRRKKVRIISARDINRKEVQLYEKAT